ncbi:hypothetical protein J4Q44_G00285080 [Coregonus suidteri]|uniref:CBF1-interacting co-repressor CIR N-terminal domain-containing protein n=1 Tax=Coregonus suidteri TaxID=861788 RepID=A0AAN8QD52_9TELE
MGGGDLNLKKSWHPQTMKNIERVWKAEQKHEAEVKKIEELQKELRDERAREDITRFAQQTGALKKKEDRLDWMYQGPGVRVRLNLKTFHPCIPTREHGFFVVFAKIREDPLFDIRKREEEKKREVLTNPVKMKKIKEMSLSVKSWKKKRRERWTLPTGETKSVKTTLGKVYKTDRMILENEREEKRKVASNDRNAGFIQSFPWETDLYIGLAGLATDVQTVSQRLKFKMETSTS